MTPFIFNMFLAVVWTALTGRLDLANFALGFALGALALWLSRGLWDGSAYFRRVGRVIGLVGWSLVELVGAGFQEALWAFRWGRRATTRIEVPLMLQSDGQVALFSSLVSLSPSTLVVGVSRERATLIVETAPDNAGALEARVTRLLERQIRGLTR
jgi:multicomponent Na+:H+ antiporter subunit E